MREALGVGDRLPGGGLVELERLWAAQTSAHSTLTARSPLRRNCRKPRASAPLMLQAFELARTLDHRVYDCFHLALAEALQMPLVTADGRFAAAAQHHGPITLLGER